MLVRSNEEREWLVYTIQPSIQNMGIKARQPPWRAPFPAARGQTSENSGRGLIVRVKELQKWLKVQAGQPSYAKVRALREDVGPETREAGRHVDRCTREPWMPRVLWTMGQRKSPSQRGQLSIAWKTCKVLLWSRCLTGYACLPPGLSLPPLMALIPKTRDRSQHSLSYAMRNVIVFFFFPEDGCNDSPHSNGSSTIKPCHYATKSWSLVTLLESGRDLTCLSNSVE